MESVIKRPIINEKATARHEQGVYGFVVERRANKQQIAEAVRRMFGVNVDHVNTINVRGKVKTRYMGGRMAQGRTASYKKALVYLKPGETIDFFAEL